MIRWFSVLLLVFLASCGQRPSTPNGIMPPDKMEAILWDLIQSGEFLNGYVLFKDTMTDKTAESLKWYDKVLAIHKVSKADFRKSYDWYRANPKMMGQVLDSLSKTPAPPAVVDTSKGAAASQPVQPQQSNQPYPVRNITPDPRGLLQKKAGQPRPQGFGAPAPNPPAVAPGSRTPAGSRPPGLPGTRRAARDSSRKRTFTEQ